MHNSVVQHYSEFLGPVYSWSISPLGDRFAAATEWLRSQDLLRPGAVLDLGAGFGAHVVPLAKAGATVCAVDSDPGLVHELNDHLTKRALKSQVVRGDAIEFIQGTSEKWDVVLCLGDTITHFETKERVNVLLQEVSTRLRSGGALWLRWRDTSGALPTGLSRFIPVAKDAHREMHCFVEEVDAHQISVTDIVTEVRADGPLTRMSSYRKLRLGVDELTTWARGAGMKVVSTGVSRGMAELCFALE